MQNKGALKLLVFALAIACAYQLSFTVVTSVVEKNAKTYAAGNPVREQTYLDSVKTKPVYNLGFVKFTYKQCKEKEINLGLDLRGGMNVMLEIAVEDVVRALSNDSKDPMFQQAMVQARLEQKAGAEDFIGNFSKAYSQISGGKSLAPIFNTPALKDLVTPNSTNDQVIKVLRDQTESAIASSFNVLRKRIDRFGVTQPNIQRLGNSGRILVELPGVKEPERVRKLLQGTASLEFWATYDNSEIYPLLAKADEAIKILESTKSIEEVVEPGVVGAEEVVATENGATVAAATPKLLLEGGQDTTSTTNNNTALEADHPLFSLLSPMGDQMGQLAGGPVVGRALFSDTAKINNYLNMPQIKGLLPRDAKLMWTVKGVDEAETVFELVAVKANTRDGKAPLDGSSIQNAREDYSKHGSTAEVSMSMSASGAQVWAGLTRDNIGKSIAIVLDGYVYSYPRVNGEITGGSSSITGNFTIQEAKDLANVLKSGKLPAPARIIQDTVVGPTLGKESIQSGMSSFLLAFVLVLLYMILFYNKSGMVASIALLTNLFFLFGVLVSFGAVLTLPGIAGIVLTMGMAVDANVIIYERIKEELHAGKSIGISIADGFKEALSAIIDGNVTTLITGIVLFIFGTGPVQGFATTLIIGIITSMFCSILITRMIFVSMLEKGRKITFSNRFTENFLKNIKFDFIGIRKITYIISGALILVSIVSLATRGVNSGVDFTGGRVYVVRFDSHITDDQVRDALSTVFSSADANESFEVKQFGSDLQFQKRIVTQYKYDDEGDNVSAEVGHMLYNALAPLYTYPISESAFLSTDVDINGVVSSDKVGASVASDIRTNSFIAVIFSLLAIGFYIFVRFKKWQWGMGAIVSLAHDAFLTVGVFSLFYGILPFSMEVDQSFIAAILTIIGYSINDTVVIFDRIREYEHLYPKRDMKNNINNAISSTMARTVNTAGTTIVTLLAIFLFGGEVIRGFVFALLFGIVVGTFSSIFVATPFAYDLMNKKDRNETKEEEKKKALK